MKNFYLKKKYTETISEIFTLWIHFIFKKHLCQVSGISKT